MQLDIFEQVTEDSVTQIFQQINAFIDGLPQMSGRASTRYVSIYLENPEGVQKVVQLLSDEASSYHSLNVLIHDDYQTTGNVGDFAHPDKKTCFTVRVGKPRNNDVNPKIIIHSSTNDDPRMLDGYGYDLCQEF